MQSTIENGGKHVDQWRMRRDSRRGVSYVLGITLSEERRKRTEGMDKERWNVET